MVYVRLARGWTDTGGTAHTAGDMVNVDAITLAQLEQHGVVVPAGEIAALTWAGPRRGAGYKSYPPAWPGQPRGIDDARLPAWTQSAAVAANWPGPTGPRPGPDDEPSPAPADPWPGPTDPDAPRRQPNGLWPV